MMQKQPESTGDKGVELICQFEGLKLERYRDAVGYGPSATAI
jgi:GH24 family phage-related lysozyme (muramidase)